MAHFLLAAHNLHGSRHVCDTPFSVAIATMPIPQGEIAKYCKSAAGEAATELAMLLNSAYTTLMDESARRIYQQEVSSAGCQIQPIQTVGDGAEYALRGKHRRARFMYKG